jgi:protein-S-isoprenylcysteine O-methyltransferase Ste14
MSNPEANPTEKGAFVAALVFYCLVAFEFFYMATPFAVYFYSVYGPGLDLIENFGASTWLLRFFMPHIARETSSVLINYHEYFGMALFLGGIAAFLAGAVQIYVNKIRKKGAEVTKGLYKSIRHPQYLALMASGLGMVIVWPRYLVLLAFVTLAFVYVILARTEEGICLRKFPGYKAYHDQTGMFLPRWLEKPFRSFPRTNHRLLRVAIWLLAYVAVLAAAVALAVAINGHAVRSLYGLFEKDSAIISVGVIPEAKLRAIVGLAMQDTEVKQWLAEAAQSTGGPQKIMGYVLPTDVYVSEIPMVLPPNASFGHLRTTKAPTNHYKIILTHAIFANGMDANGRDIVSTAINKRAVAEVHIDLASDQLEGQTKGRIVQRLKPPELAFYRGMPVPLY